MRSIGDETPQGVAFRLQRGKARFQRRGHLVELPRQQADLIVALHGRARGQIAVAHLLRSHRQIAHRRGQSAADHEAHRRGQQRGAQGRQAKRTPRGG